MTPFTRLWSLIEEKIAELIRDAFSYASPINLIICEASTVLVFVITHKILQKFLDESPWCLMRVVAFAMMILFMITNVQYVIVMVLKHTQANVKVVKDLINPGPRQRRKSAIAPKHPGEPRCEDRNEKVE